MGMAQGRLEGEGGEATAEQMLILNSFPEGLDINRRQFRGDCMVAYSVVNGRDEEKEQLQQRLFVDKRYSVELGRALASMLGMVCADSLGHVFEFSAVRYGVTEMLDGFSEAELWRKSGYNRFQLKPGQWTDDAAMGLCLAESLLEHPEFDPLDLRVRFLNWWTLGYCNAFGYDPERGRRTSVGLGGNISESMQELVQKRTPYTTAGHLETSGNGSLMRAAAVAIKYHGDVEKAMDVAYKQSKCTHQGEEAAELCRLLAWVCVNAIHGDGSRAVLDRLGEEFQSPLYSVQCLARSVNEEPCEENSHLKIEDRQWNWKAPNWRFCESRAQQQPGYVGSYSMDGICAALHCVYHTTSFKDAVLRAVNLRGDADSHGSMTGQIAGTIYGLEAVPPDWITAVQQWDNHGQVVLRAALLFGDEPASLK